VVPGGDQTAGPRPDPARTATRPRGRWRDVVTAWARCGVWAPPAPSCAAAVLDLGGPRLLRRGW